MAVQNFPFDSLSADNPDRAANSKIFADYLKSFFSDGIFPVLTQFPDMHQLAVRASNPAGMSVVVDTGMGLISGRQYAQDAERTLQIPAADTSLPRKDRIVLRMDLNTQYRNNELYVMTGTAASSPQPPALTRNNVVYELALATISVAANATSITAADITDERANTDVCGYVTNVLGQVDTSVINAQFQAFFEQTQENTADWEDAQQAAFTAWFGTIKGQLGEDAAGNLQNQIGVLSNLTTSEKSNLVDAINEVNAKEPDVLDTMEEIDANTDAGKVAGALAVKELSSERNIFLRSFNYTELAYGSQNFSSGFVIIAKVNRVVIANVDVYFKIGLTPGVAHQILSKSQLVDINCWIPTPTGNQFFTFESIAISGVNKNLAIIGLNGSDNAANGLTIYPLDVPTGVGDHIRHQLIWVSE